MGEGSYFNFDLIIEQAGEKYRARVIDSPAGQASTEFNIPFSELELENFVLRMGRPRAGVRRVDSSELEAVKQCGERLFRAVFTDDVYASFLRSRDTALEDEKGLRVRLRIDVPEFHDYPWEFLYNAHLNQFLALSKDTPVVRYLELPYPVQPLTVQPPLKVLVMISSPDGFPKLKVEDEWKRLSNALAPLLRRGLVTLERLKSPTLSALQQHLRRGEYHIFHFIGHGTFSEHKQDGMLLLEEENGRGRPVSGQYLGTVLHDHRSLRLVVLNACEGARTSQEDPYAGVAQTLVLQGIPAVIAMQFEIVETAAITFAQEFYGAVADGFPVDAAVSEARKAIFATGNDVEWGTPVLYMRTPQGVIFEIPEALRARQPVVDEPVYVDRELEQKLDGLYTEGLAAFWVEDWDKACDRFQRILTDRPDHAAAADKLAEAKRQRNLANLYTRAIEAQKDENWSVALKTLEELQKESPDYKDTTTTLKLVKKQKRLAELYAEAKQLSAAKKWEAVAKVFAQIKSIDPDYPDTENLLPTAEKELVELKRQAELNKLYSQAVHAMDAGHWEDAQRLLTQVWAMEPGFLETEKLLSKIKAEIQQTEEQQKRQDQINTLYEQAHGLLRSKKWRPALDKIEEINKLDERFDDTEKIAERAQQELVREEQEAERQNELAAMYAEAVRLLREEKYQEALEKWQEIKSIDAKYPDRQKVQKAAKNSLTALAKPVTAKRKITMPKSLWIGAGGIVTIIVVVLAIVLSGKNGEEPSSPPIPDSTLSSSGNIVVPTATKLPSSPSQESDLLYEENFETGKANNWVLGPGWQVTQDGSNYVLSGEGFQFAMYEAGNEWADYSIRFKLKLIQGAIHLDYRRINDDDENGPGEQSQGYWVEFREDYLNFSKIISRNWETLSEKNIDFALNAWHDIEVVSDGNDFLIYVDGALLMRHHDTDPVRKGTFWFVTLDDSKALIDNIEVEPSSTSNSISDPTMYDDFDNPPDGLYNTSLWSPLWNVNYATVRKKDGQLSFTVNDTHQYRLVAEEYKDISIGEPFFLEANLFLDPATTSDFTHLMFGIDSVHKITGDEYGTGCGIFSENEIQSIQCGNFEYKKNSEPALVLDNTSPNWHTVRIEITPPGVIRYIIDGILETEYTFSKPDEFNNLQFYVNLGMNMHGNSATGYFDNIRIGAIEDDPLAFYDDFSESPLGLLYQEGLPRVSGYRNDAPTDVANYQGKSNYSFETIDGSSVIRLSNRLNDASRKGWVINKTFTITSFELEVRFNTLVQSPKTGIDQMIELWLIDGTDIKLYDQVIVMSWNYGEIRNFSAESTISEKGKFLPFDFADNTWYRLLITGSAENEIIASVYDDDKSKKFVTISLGHTVASFPSGFKIGISQSMGGPGGIYPTDVAIDWIKFASNRIP